jgi:hypothetical protein
MFDNLVAKIEDVTATAFANNVIDLPTSQEIKRIIDRERIQMQIDWAIDALSREDRIVWYLRRVQMAIFRDFINLTDGIEDPQIANIHKFYNKKKYQFMTQNGIAGHTDYENDLSVSRSSDFREASRHYLSQPIPEINRYEFTGKSWSTIQDDLGQLESDWKSRQDRMIHVGRDNEYSNEYMTKFMDFKDGYAWFEWGAAYCPQEARSMGHCGNSPRMSTDDTILSLRKEDRHDGEIFHTPYLTFILNGDHWLTEMKGRNNEKPQSRYHKYIIPLLLDDRIEGIIGGGYMPENNFSPYDLDEVTREELFAEKASLKGPMDMIHQAIAAGNKQEALEGLEGMMDELGMEYFELHFENETDDDVVLRSWEDYESVANDFYDEPVTNLYSVLDDLKDAAESFENVEEVLTDNLYFQKLEKYILSKEDMVYDLIAKLHPRTRNMLFSKHTASERFMNAPEDQQIQAFTNMWMKNPTGIPAYQYLADAIEWVYEEGNEDAKSMKNLHKDVKKGIADEIDRVTERIQEYADHSYAIRPHQVGVYPTERGENTLKSRWVMGIPLHELVGIVEAGVGMRGQEDYYDDEYQYAYYDWTSSEGLEPDWENTNEGRQYNYDGKSTNLAGMGDSDDVYGAALEFLEMIDLNPNNQPDLLQAAAEDAFDAIVHDFDRMIRQKA